MVILKLNYFLQAVLNWSEVWALMIPLFIVIVAKKKQSIILKPILVYLVIGLFLNVCADLIADLKVFFPSWLQSNNPIYNLHSLVRFACFSYFFFNLKKRDAAPTNKKNVPSFKVMIVAAFVIFLIINFIFYENFFNPFYLSGGLFAIESYLLLIFCMQYYLIQLQNEVEHVTTRKDFWIVTGLSIYVVINFFIFLFYVPMISENRFLAARMWDVHNVAFIIFCILISKAFYVSDSHRS